MRHFSFQHTLLCLGLLLMTFASQQSASASTNLALGKTYTSTLAASSTYPDTNGKELTDGLIPTGDLNDSRWQGRSGSPTYSQTVDLGHVNQAQEFTCYFLQETPAAINLPTSVTFSTSLDNVTFTSLGTATAYLISSGTANGIPFSIYEYVLDPTLVVNLRYVKMTVVGNGWAFEDELQAWGPTPTNLAVVQPYTSTLAASSSYPDVNARQLTDGLAASSDASDTKWQGRANSPSYSQTVDLGQNKQITEISCLFLKETPFGINLPTSVTYSSSPDGTTFTTLGTGTSTLVSSGTVNGTAYSIYRYVYDPKSMVYSRYIKMAVSGTGWTFEDELQVWGIPPQVLAGSFIQSWYPVGNNWTALNYDIEFGWMITGQMDHMILQSTATIAQVSGQPDSKTTIYPTSMSGWTQSGTGDPIATMLTTARTFGIKVWLGLDSNYHFFNDANASTTAPLLADFQTSEQVAQDLWNRYSSYSDVIAGFYLYPEVDNAYEISAQAQQNLKTAYADAVTYIHTHMSKPVMAAPFFNSALIASGALNPQQYATFWAQILQSAPLDVLALQDGVGDVSSGVAHAQVTDSSQTSFAGNWFSAFQSAFITNKVSTQLWSDLETYQTDYNGLNPTSAAISRVMTQIYVEQAYVKKFTSFSFNHYDSPQLGSNAVPYYTAYKPYVDRAQQITVNISSPASGAMVSGIVNINATATDASTVVTMILSIDGVVKTVTGNASLSYSWDTSTVASGTHCILVTTTDSRNMQDAKQITVTH